MTVAADGRDLVVDQGLLPDRYDSSPLAVRTVPRVILVTPRGQCSAIAVLTACAIESPAGHAASSRRPVRSGSCRGAVARRGAVLGATMADALAAMSIQRAKNREFDG